VDRFVERLRRIIIILSPIMWEGLTQRVHHLARQFAELGNILIFVEPPTLILRSTNISSLIKDTTRLKQFLFYQCLENAKRYSGVTVITTVSGFSDGSRTVNVGDLTRRLIIDHYASRGSCVVICYLPQHYLLVDNQRYEPGILYDCVDDHEGTYWAPKNAAEFERKLIGIADWVVTTSDELYVRKGKMCKKTFLVKNGVDPAMAVSNVLDLKLESKRIDWNRPTIGYVGAMKDWFNHEWVINAAKVLPEINFVLIGPDSHVTWKNECPQNMYFLGPQPHNHLSAYLRLFDIGMIPFRNDRTLVTSCNPIKAHEYIAANLPFVGPQMPELVEMQPWAHLASSFDEFVGMLKQCLTIDRSTWDYKSYVAKNSWRQRALTMQKIFENQLVDSRLVRLREMRKKYSNYLNGRNSSSPIAKLLREIEAELALIRE